MLNRVERLFNFAESPIIPLKTYRTLEHDQNDEQRVGQLVGMKNERPVGLLVLRS
jgi:hypothetical protein